MPDTDDSWAEFYREIGLEPEAPAAPVAAAEPPADEEPDAEDVSAEAEADEGEEGSEESAGAEGPAGEEELNEDGTKKRRRRRRRRSKKKGGPEGEATESSGEAEAETEEADEPLAEVYAEDGGPTPEASRELIANWDVPSWTEIVAGLHRPSGNDRRG